MISKLRENYLTYFLSLLLVLVILINPFQLQHLSALTSGPSQPEAHGFQPVESKQLVDPFTGDFSYNVPLLKVGDYPINLSYHSDVKMKQEATWVGLGWKLNIGVIKRSMRGLPDDFKGEAVKKKLNIKDNLTVGGGVGIGDIELAGMEAEDFSLNAESMLNVKYNNYKGLSISRAVSFGFAATASGQVKNTSFLGSYSFGLSGGTDGFSIEPKTGFGLNMAMNQKNTLGLQVGYGLKINSREGLQKRTISPGLSFENSSNKPTKINSKGFTQGYTNLYNPVNYTPSSSLPFENSGLTFSVKVGGKLFLPEASGIVKGYYSKQSLKTNEKENPAFGYLYLQDGQKNKNALLDCNREKDVPISPGRPNLPLTYLTYDIFQVGAQGISGTFRPYRNDVGYVFKPMNNNTSTSKSVGGEFNTGETTKAGVDISVTESNSTTGSWEELNAAINDLIFTEKTKNEGITNVYFKQVGSLSRGVSDSYITKTGNNLPLKFSLIGGEDELEVGLSNRLVDDHNKEYNLSHVDKKMYNPFGQSTSFHPLTVEQINKSNSYHKKYISKEAQPHHIGQIKAYNRKGKRYVFGLPAYNHLKKEVSFSVDQAPGNDGLVKYDKNDNSINNNKGLSHYFNSVVTPPYAYAYFLTDVLSPDYIDRTNNGPTPDDQGKYIKISYAGPFSYKWRTPMGKNKAEYDEGKLSIQGKYGDEKASYVYGEKDLWYPDTIRSKSQIAIFHTSKRKDALEVKTEDGGIGGKVMRKLDSISLYNLYDFKDLGTSAEPIKRICFKYNYKLCPNVVNSNAKGKLTLQKVYFKYGNSNKARHAYYNFSYSDFNPSYKMQSNDRWGYYKQSGSVKNKYFPYSTQDKQVRDIYVSAWLLDKIQLPAGGYIKIDYESDDYTFVQEKRAMRMYKLAGSSHKHPQQVNQLDNKLYGSGDIFRYMYFKLDSNFVTKSRGESYVNGLVDSESIQENLYFKIKTNVNDIPEKFDYIFGYCALAEENNNGVKKLNGDWYGWIKVETVPTDRPSSAPLHPMAKAGMQFCRNKTPQYAYEQPSRNLIQKEPEIAVKNLFENTSLIKGLIDFCLGPNNALRLRNIANKFKKDASWIRLLAPKQRKLGGGARVRKLVMGNNWDQMESGEDSIRLIQEYSYQTETGHSSGVATYEPLIGGDVIPHHVPVTYKKSTDQPRWARMLVPSDVYMVERPFGEFVFPAPSVGYSRVKIKNVSPGQRSPESIGYTIKKFLTAKNFPIITTHTPIDVERRKKNTFFSFFKKKIRDYYSASQGYSILTNNMHGKPKSTFVYDANGNLISSKMNEYTLGQKVNVLTKEGMVEKKHLGLEEDITIDFIEQTSTTRTTSQRYNFSMFTILGVPIPIFILLPKKLEQKNRFRSATTTKVIYNYGVLKKQTTTDLGASVTKENLVYDPVSGAPVLTKVNNAFQDTIYNLTYPAHQIYEGMSSAALNANIYYHLSTNKNGRVVTTAPLLNHGDQLLNLSSSQYTWVYQRQNKSYLINKKGERLSGLDADFIVLRPGRRNRISAQAGKISCLKKPLKRVGVSPDRWTFEVDSSHKILDAKMQTFDNYWHTSCLDSCICRTTKYEKQLGDLFSRLIKAGKFYNEGKIADLPTLFTNANYVGVSDSFYYNFTRDLIPLCLDKAGLNENDVSLISWIADSDTPDPHIFTGHFAINNEFPCCRFRFHLQGGQTIDSLRHYSGFFDEVALTPTHEQCDTSYQFKLLLKASRGPAGPKRIVIEGKNPCYPTRFCHRFGSACGWGRYTKNPFINGIYGRWRAHKTFEFLTPRAPLHTNTPSVPHTGGYYKNFRPFWSYDTLSQDWRMDTTGWTRANEVTLYDPHGHPLESRDALGRYQSAQYGYHNQLPIATTENARYREMGYEGFEGYYPGLPGCSGQCPSDCRHLRFKQAKRHLDHTFAHTGLYSLRLAPGEADTIRQPARYPAPHQPAMPTPAPSYPLGQKDCIGAFTPLDTGYAKPKKFIMSFWVSNGQTATPALPSMPGAQNYFPDDLFDSYGNKPSPQQTSGPGQLGPAHRLDLKVQLDAQQRSVQRVYTSPVIEGWQQVRYTFTLPPGQANIFRVRFYNRAGNTHPLYLDDVRLHPYDAQMKSYVYHPYTHRVMAVLDKNNFATFYQYDERGQLQEKIKETEKGRLFMEYTRKERSMK